MVNCKLKRNKGKKECLEVEKMRKFAKEQMRLGGSKDYAEGYKQGMKDCKRMKRW